MSAPDLVGAGVTVLRSGVGSLPSMGVLRELQRLGCRVVAVDADPSAVGFEFADRHAVIPRADDPAFATEMAELCRREGVDILLPAVNEELEPLDRIRDDLARDGTVLVAPSTRTIKACLDKIETAEVLDRIGVPTPRTALPAGELPAFPAIIKPRWGRGSRGVVRVDDTEELEYHLARAHDPVVIQELVDGEELSCDLLATESGELRMLAVRRRLRVNAGISVVGEIVAAGAVLPWIERLTRDLPLSGPACVQCIVGADGIPRFTDLNPRLGGGVALSIHSGTPLLAGLLAMVRGEEVPRVIDAGVGRTFHRYYSEVYR